VEIIFCLSFQALLNIFDWPSAVNGRTSKTKTIEAKENYN
jgi:hypothetical protein